MSLTATGRFGSTAAAALSMESLIHAVRRADCCPYGLLVGAELPSSGKVGGQSTVASWGRGT